MVPFIATIIVYLMRFFPTVGQALNLMMKIVSEAKMGRDVTEIISKRFADDEKLKKITKKITKIEFKGVSFKYENSPNKAVLSDINVCFDMGKSYAIVGASGQGKSTMFDLLLKFYQPSLGNISINGTSISHISSSEIRKKIVLVNQEPAIFDDTILNNLSLGLDLSLEKVKKVCKQVCIDDFIGQLPESYNTRLEYQGSNLSGGQRQRIAIARSLLRGSDVLIFDESTSALDKYTQTIIVKNILECSKDKIIIFITHDPEVMAAVDVTLNIKEISDFNI
jgi:ABC-type multidrug transport system fused ATPase/permease subunit